MTSIIYGNPCCICLEEISNTKSKNNRFKFGMMNKETKKKEFIDLCICDDCITTNNVKSMSQNDLLNKLIPQIHPAYMKKLCDEH